MNELLRDVKSLAEANALKFKDCGNGHVQISGHGVLVNYYPMSKRRSVYCPTTGLRLSDCSAWDAARLCLSETPHDAIKPKKVSKNRPQVDLKPVSTNPAGIKHFYSGEVPPWDESLGDFSMEKSDELRVEAYQLACKAEQLRYEADELDGEAK